MRETLTVYSDAAWSYHVGRHFQDVRHGYQWWNVRASDHTYWLAWVHGGQPIGLLHGLDMVIVAKADHLVGQHGDGPWKLEMANLNLVADYFARLPAA